MFDCHSQTWNFLRKRAWYVHRQLTSTGIFYVTGLPTEYVPRELATFFREVLDNGGTIHAERYGEPSPSHWPEQHEVGGGVFRQCNYIIRPLQSTYDLKLSLLRHTVSETKAGSASRPMSHQCINMTVYFISNVFQSSHDTFYCVFFISDVQYNTLIFL